MGREERRKERKHRYSREELKRERRGVSGIYIVLIRSATVNTY
jgi:hypothetical protein